MPISNRIALIASLSAALLLISNGAFSAPVIRVIPPNGARFAVDQRFDIRAEFDSIQGELTDVVLALDGQALSGAPDANHAITLRKLSCSKPGMHTITATAKDGSGSSSASATFEVIDPSGSDKKARNVIVFLGDGMGVAHRTAARIVRFGVEGGHAKGRLAMDQFPGMGLVSTHSLNSIVTDSSPGMSSYMTGNKGNNNQEGVYPDDTVSAKDAADNSASFDNPRVEYLSEYSHRKFHKATGIVTTADIEDATPAACAIHTANRDAGTGICDQYFDERANSGLKVLMGGGRRWFLPQELPGSSRSAETDYRLDADSARALGVPSGAIDPKRDLLRNFEDDGFAYVSSRTELLNAKPDADKLLGLFAYGNMNAAWDKLAKQRNPGEPGVVDDYMAPDQPMLDEMTRAALNVLNRNDDGFLLMVEGAHIDKQSHLMDSERAIVETIEFDNAIAVARDFAEKKGEFAHRAGNVGDTTILVTADHECSGFSIIGASSVSTSELKALPPDKKQGAVGTMEKAKFPHYKTDERGYPLDMDPDGKLLIGFGANADRTEDWLSQPRPIIDILISADLSSQLQAKGYLAASGTTGPDGTAGVIRRKAKTGYFIAGQAPGYQAVHTATDVAISSYGPGWGQFVGEQDNTDDFFFMLRAFEGGYPSPE